MCEQQARAESAAPVAVQQGGTVMRKTMKHHITSPPQDPGEASTLSCLSAKTTS